MEGLGVEGLGGGAFGWIACKFVPGQAHACPREWGPCSHDCGSCNRPPSPKPPDGSYANRAKNITNRPRINEDPKDAMLRWGGAGTAGNS